LVKISAYSSLEMLKFSFLAIIIIIVLLVFSGVQQRQLAFVEPFESASYPNAFLGYDPSFNYQDYWDYRYPYNIYRSEDKCKNLIRNYGKPMYITLFQVVDKPK